MIDHPAEPGGLDTMIVASPAMVEIRAQAERAARTAATVLITGESGVGKDLVAQTIHRHSPRSRRPFVAVNCAGLTETLLESELFGHARGSFTGAHRDHQGKLQAANGGTLFLDEVGEMSLRMQALLLRFLENGEIQPVGGTGPATRLDVRVIAATNRNLPERIAAGQFREDLLYRLQVIPLHIPPLRERPEDIQALLARWTRSLDRPLEFSPDALRALLAYRWPGNVRELQNVVLQVAWLADAPIAQWRDLPERVRESACSRVVPRHERRRQIADQLYETVVAGECSFWEHVYPLFIARDITRHDLRQLVTRGLAATRGNYRALLKLFRLPASDYHRFHNFLATHDCKVDYRAFRREPRVASALPPQRERRRAGRPDAPQAPADHGPLHL
jgi:transcriptional regulator with PAS, ATPase and Fis domain